MAKIELSKVEIVDRTTGQKLAEYWANTRPKESNVGNTWPLQINAFGIYALQAGGQKVYNEKDCRKMIQELVRQHLNIELTDEMIGNRGPVWRTAEGRAKYKVLINGVEFYPPLKESNGTKDVTPEAIAPVTEIQIPTPEVVTQEAVVEVPQPVVEQTPEPVVMTDTTPVEIKLSEMDNGLLKQIQEAIKNPDNTDEKIMGALIKSVGEDKAELLFGIAKRGSVAKIEAPQPQTVSAPMPEPVVVPISAPVPQPQVTVPTPVPTVPQPVKVQTDAASLKLDL